MTAIAAIAAVRRPPAMRGMRRQLRTLLAARRTVAAWCSRRSSIPIGWRTREQGLVRTFDEVVVYSATWRDWLATGRHRCTTRGGATRGSSAARRRSFPASRSRRWPGVRRCAETAWRDPPRAHGAGDRRRRAARCRSARNVPGYHGLFDVGAHPERHPGRLAVGMADAVRAADPGRLRPGRAARRRSANARGGAGGGAGLLVTVEALRAPMEFTHLRRHPAHLRSCRAPGRHGAGRVAVPAPRG